ncbi:MAG: 2-dehydro-3-deoxy-6-phosphogalactonate aldolase [Alphaproteobacteria bacterium]|nr:2-dehydro-3-deoxy-6-phosphogalactonate aldolase [Alphaproteobacteria bacterium]
MLSTRPLIAILRGLRPAEAAEIGEALVAAGLLCAEVPLNSPDAPESIAILKRVHGHKLLVGAGTVLSVPEVAIVAACGAELVVSPNTNPAVIAATKAAGLLSVPGFVTPSEAFAAIDAGADALKAFPTDMVSPAALRALREVLPAHMPVLPVGGVTIEKIGEYRKAGAAGFGIGSAIYRPGRDAASVLEKARDFVEAFHGLG